MPEYLAPGVYVEEVDTGSKPIEGVSTSTTGMVGVTERGPVDVPVLITGVGRVQPVVRRFAARGRLRGPSVPPARGRRLLHQRRQACLRHARPRRRRVEGRVAALRPRRRRRRSRRRSCGRPGRGRARPASPPPLVVLAVAGLADDDWIRIDDGSGAEYRQVDGAPVAETVLVSLHLPARPLARRG